MAARFYGEGDAPSGGTTRPFVGRERELAMLEADVRRALGGLGGSILLSGEPGIGKTRTAEEVGAIARREGAAVFTSRGWEGEGAPPFWLWVQIVRGCIREVGAEVVLSRMGPTSRDLFQLMPGLRELIPKNVVLPTTKDYLETNEVRFRVFDGIATLLRSISNICPLAIILDDLHCSDIPSLILLDYLARELRGSRLLIVVTYRDTLVGVNHPLSRAIAALVRYSFGRQTVLKGLSKPAVAQFLELEFEGNLLSPVLAAAVWERTEGNPFFVAEVANLLISEGTLAAAMESLQASRIPSTIRDVIRRRLGCLSDAAQEVLSVASIVGREFDRSMLTWLTGLTGDQTLVALDEALVARVIVEVSADEHLYRFTHVLIRETLYEDLPRPKRARLHSSLAVKLEELLGGGSDDHLSLLAHHFCRGVPHVDARRAAWYAARAGKAARDSLAYEEAASCYSRALQLLPVDGSPPGERCDILLGLGEAQARTGDWLAARNTYAAAGRCAKALGAADKFAIAAAGFKGLIPGKNPPDLEAIGMLREALQLLGSSETVARARTLGELARALYFATEQGEASRCSREAVSIARGLEDPVTLGNALEARLYTLWRPSDLQETLRVSGELINVSSLSGDRELHCRGLMFRYSCLLETGDRIGSSGLLEQAKALAHELKNPRYNWQVALACSAAAFCKGDYEEARKLADNALRIGSRVHDSSAEHYKVLSDFLLQRMAGGDGSKLVEVLCAGVACYPQIGIYEIGLAMIQEKKSHVLHTLPSIVSLVGRVQPNALQLFSLGLLAELAYRVADYNGMSIAYGILGSYANHNIVVSWGAACDGSVSHYLGLLAGALERWDDAVRHFEDALEMNGRMNFVPFVARTEHFYAATLLRRGERDDRDRAVAMLSNAIATYRRLGMQGYLRDALKIAATVPELSKVCENSSEAQGNPERIEVREREDSNADGESAPAEEDRPSPPDVAQKNLFRREGEYWTLRYRGRVTRLKNMRGLECIAFLLGRPCSEVHCLDLCAFIGRGASSAAVREDTDRLSKEDRLRVARLGDAGPLLDAKSRARYRSRLRALGREVEDAERLNDVLKAAAARREMEMLARELSAGTRRGGGPRLAGSYAERARINVRNNIAAALRAIRRHDEELWRHLYRGVRTGTYCAYIPEAGVDWEL